MPDDFLNNTSAHTRELFWHFADPFIQFGKITLHPTKSMIGFTHQTRIAYVIHLGKNFIDVVFPFGLAYGNTFVLS
jgi:hypothetical protein